MPKHNTHKFVGQVEGTALAEWLNRKRHVAKEVKKVSEIISQLRALNGSGETVSELFAKKMQKAQTTGQRSVSFDISDFTPSAQYIAVLRRLDRLLAGCWMRPRIVEHEKHETTFGWVYRPKRAEGVHLLMQLMALNLGDRIRICERSGCNRWLFARFPQERFCSKQCGSRHRQSSEGRKEKRREWYRARKVLKNTTKIGAV
jgi:hypothetical protein